MKFSYSWLKELVPGIPPPHVLAEMLTSHSYQVESVQKLGRDFVFDIDILPNRMPDSSGHIGVAREAALIIKKKLVLPSSALSKGLPPPKKILSVDLATKETHRYIAVLFEGVRMADSPSYMRERLEACGFRPINNIVDATNYIMLETGYPAHAFDYDKIAGKKITVRHAGKGEVITLLGGSSLRLERTDLVIADEKGPLAISGVKGGLRAEVDQKTTRVVFEVAVFDPARVRKTSRRLGIMTDALIRFSAGLSPDGLDRVALRLADVAERITKGKKSGFIDVGRRSDSQGRIMLRYSHVSSMLGITVPQKNILDILKRLGCAILVGKKEFLYIVAPKWRRDLVSEDDIVEEIGRLNGYEHIHSAPPSAALEHPEEDVLHAYADRVREEMKNFGFFEVENYAFGEKSFGALEIANPMSRGFSHLRTSLLPGLLKNIDRNKNHAKALKFFEIGKVFRGGAKKPEESLASCAVMTREKKSRDLYFEAKGIVESLFNSFGIAGVSFKNIAQGELPWPLAPKTAMHPYRSAVVLVDSLVVGALYELHPEMGVKVPTVTLEFLMEKLAGAVDREREFRPIPKYPLVVRDIALVVPSEEHVENIVSIIERAAGPLLVDSDLFDYYEEEKIGEGKKSLAFHLIYQATDRTLRDEEVARSLERLLGALRREGWEVRE